MRLSEKSEVDKDILEMENECMAINWPSLRATFILLHLQNSKCH